MSVRVVVARTFRLTTEQLEQLEALAKVGRRRPADVIRILIEDAHARLVAERADPCAGTKREA